MLGGQGKRAAAVAAASSSRTRKAAPSGSGDHGQTRSDGKKHQPRHPSMLGRCRAVVNFERLDKIGWGTYGVVYRARDKRTGDIVALKKLRMEREKEGMPLTSVREIRLLQKISHVNVVQLKEVVVGKTLESIFLVFEYAEHDLATLIDKVMRKPFSESEVKCLLRQLLSAVGYLHTLWMLHRDIKMSNLLYNNAGVLKLADFGLARLYGEPRRQYTPRVVTLWYRAPELLLADRKLQAKFRQQAETETANKVVFEALTGGGSGDGGGGKGPSQNSVASGAPKVEVDADGNPHYLYKYGPAVDLWSIGCIFAELLLGEPLFPANSEFDLLKRVFRELGAPSEKIWPEFTRLWAGYSTLGSEALSLNSESASRLRAHFPKLSRDGGFSLLSAFLTYDPDKRISASEALEHRYFRESPRPQAMDMMPTFPSSHSTGSRKSTTDAPAQSRARPTGFSKPAPSSP